MSFQLNLPPSVISQMAKTEEGVEEGEVSTGKKREDWKKLKELEEARKAGTAPAMQDEEGKDINPHIPQYIMQAPWYFGSTTPTLNHQRTQAEKHKQYDNMSNWLKKGVKEGPVATKYRKGACENCGAMTHIRKDCLERPRKVGARFSGSDIAPDEYIPDDLLFDYEGKRDRWNSYDQEHHKRIVEEEYARIEEAKQVLKAQRLETGLAEGETEDEKKGDLDSGGEEDEDKYADDVDMPGQKFETKQRITVRNLRIREDTAKYLVNLDPNSAYYDPKTRSMRQNPYAGTGKTDEEEMYAGDNFVRMSGDAKRMAEMQMFAWDAYEKGTDAHLQADPTKLAILSQEYKKKKQEYKHTVQKNILDKYGGEEHLEAPPKDLLLSQSESYVEYSRHGTIIKGQERVRVKSVYEEDVHINNHSSVWGSFWRDGNWGFQCCWSTIKGSYCTGESGKEAVMEAIQFALDNDASLAENPNPAEDAGKPAPSTTAQLPQFNTFDVGCTTEAHKEAAKRTLAAYAKQKEDAEKAKAGKGKESEDENEKEKEKRKKKKAKKRRKKKEMKRKKKKRRKSSSSSSDSSSSESEEEVEDEKAAKERKVKEAMLKEEQRVRDVNRIMGLDERKRPYNSMCNDAAPTEEEIEAWRRKQKHFEDPMSHLLSK